MASTDAFGNDNGAKDHGNFKLIKSFPIKYAPITLSKWRSEKTGLTVVLGSHEAPITNGYFAIASEIFDDTGRPHTLEHLVFLGSKSYPYKGVLDSLANRAGSNGTNAWTANDHTAYTIATAGSEGFLKMLPVYVDHILHPTITDAGFVTEVYHINGAGEDSGVVYGEMQGRENTAGDLMALEMQRTLYPPTSAYRSETGGLMHKLRVLTAQQIRVYHSKYYQPYNLCLVIDGAVPIPELFDVLNNQVDPLILEQRQNAPIIRPPEDWQRPFVESTTASRLSIPESTTKVVEFMEEDESVGEIAIVYLGPAPTDYFTNTALKILGNYLTQSTTSPLSKEFIEIPKPLSTYIGFYASDRVNKNELEVGISDVPAKHLQTMGDDFKGKLEKIVKEEGIDMERMGRVLRRDKRKLLDYMESRASDVLADAVIGDFLYGDKDGKDLPVTFEDLEHYNILEAYKAEDWIKLLDQYYVSSPSITIVGKPSAALSAKIEKDEKERVEKRKSELGEEKLKELEKKLQNAKAASDVPPPTEMISDFPLTDPASLTWVPVETAINNAKGQTLRADNGEVSRKINADGEALPYQVHFSHVKSNFVVVTALFDAIDIPKHLAPYFTLFTASIFSLGVKRADGTILSYEEAVDQLNDLTVAQMCHWEFRGNFAEVLCLSLKVQKTQYEEAIAWIRDLVTGVIYDKDRLTVIIAKLIQELPSEKRDGNSIAVAWANKLTYDTQKSSSQQTDLLDRLEFVPSIAETLEKEPDSVIQKLEELRQHLLDPSKMRVSVMGDVLSLERPRSALASSFIPVKEAKELSPLSTSRQTLSDLGQNPAKKCILVAMPAIEGSYSIHYAKGPAGQDSPDLPALRLAASVLNATESYLWKSIRGSGLAYGAHVNVYPEPGLVSFSVYRSPNAMLAYEAAGKIMKGLVDGSTELEQAIVDGARSSMTYDYARKSETVLGAAGTAYLNELLKGVGKDFDKQFLEKLPSITLDEIRGAIEKYFLPLFSSETALGSVAVSTSKAAEVEEGFKKLGFEVERKELPVIKGDESDSEGESGSEDEGEGEETGSEGEGQQ
ncbi:cytoplasmic protein [Kwoniella heveanensis BCC8398]|uniref:Presequence protease, mitochondrial n=1 Tax=Kwoniella heveanensis BCC8398 TaxID=1296120 RepID=A0A1B9H227_9TREE|nr:cytoplasmic protein [Kwoniella heveanensis BCC8398]